MAYTADDAVVGMRSCELCLRYGVLCSKLTELLHAYGSTFADALEKYCGQIGIRNLVS